MDQASAEYEDKKEADASDASFVRFWLDAIEASDKSEEDWRKEACEVIEIYRGDCDEGQDEFNIVFSNVETLLPAIYNSTPAPDVRRRYNDRDPTGKTVADLLERALSHAVDSYDFDAVMHGVLFDGTIPGRGVARVRYVPEVNEETGQSYQRVSCEYVPWQNFRRGPGRTWDDVPWVAFEHFLNRDELSKLNETLAKDVQMDCKVGGGDADGDDDDGDKDASDVFKRARVWEIWDKEKKEVVFIATGWTFEALKRADDPLKLTRFFPIPRPVQPVQTAGNLVPVTSYRSYKKLAEELNEVTVRIKKLVKQIRVKGGYASAHQDLQQIADADDGELVALQGLDAVLNGAGLDKAVLWWPIEPTVKALVQLVQHREAIKQAIYEITGISDIVRGASVASETATAQQIKQQWGSLRIQRMQGEVQRFARDLFRLKAEIIANHFEPEVISQITGIVLAPRAQIRAAKQMLAQAQQMGHNGGPQMLTDEEEDALEQAEKIAGAAPLEKVLPLLRDDILRSYRVDIESDSTIRADLTRNQKNMSDFLQGTAGFMQAVGPAVQTGQLPAEVAVEIYTAFARNFKLGKQAEDALEKMSEDAKKAAKQPKQPKPDPEMQKAQAQMQIEQQKMQMDGQAKQADQQFQMQKAQADSQMAAQKMQSDAQIATQRLQMEMQLKREEMQGNLQIKRETAAAELQMKREIAQHEAELARATAASSMDMQERQMGHKMSMAERMADSKADAKGAE